MSHRKRKKSGLNKLILPVALLLFGLSQISPEIQNGLLNIVVKPVIICALIAAILWFFSTAKNNPTKQGPWPSKKTIPKSTSVHSQVTNNTKTVTKSLTTPSTLIWSLALLQDLEWKRFELLCEAYFKTKKLNARVTKVGADGGVDIKLYKHNSNEIFALMQCKAWKGAVGIKPIREFYGVMASEDIQRGIFLCSNDYTAEAKRFCEGKRLRLMTGRNLLTAISKLEPEQQQILLKTATKGDYKTPTCPNCDIKLTVRKGKQGPFWGCLNFPRCRYTVRMRRNR